MQHSPFIAGIVAATLAVGAPGMAQNTTEAPSAEEETPTTGTTPVPEAEPAAPTEAARKTHLDELFDRLADPEAADWELVQAQIWRTWNHSGSPSMDLLAGRADKAMSAKDFDTALIHLNDLVRLAPEFAEGWNKRATLHFIRGDLGPSLNDIARTLRLEPRHFGALSGLGIILDRIGDKKGALEAYRRAVKVHPNLPGANEGIRKLVGEVEGQRL